MSIAELITSIANNVKGIKDNVLASYDAVANKNGEVPSEKTMENLPAAIASTHDTLEELTITENGTYTPLEGVDGFSKVVARVVSKRKVVLPNRTQISDTQIIDGYWAGELVDTSTMTDMESMFRRCSQLQTLDVSNWDVSGVTNMKSMFEGCSQLQSLDVSNWDVSGVTNMNSMFLNCSQLQTLDVSSWDVSSVTSMNSMFRWCSQLQTLDVSNWDVSGVTDMSNLFYDTQLQTLDVSSWDVSSVTTMQNAFRGIGIQTLDVSSWDVSSVTSMNSMFRWCSQLQTLDVSNWDVSGVTDMFNMFSECSQLQTLIGNSTIEDVIANNISALNGLKVALSLIYTILNRASLRALINGLADLTGQTAQTLTLGAKLIAKLTEEDIAIATNKNWTIA
jgi:surface protein